MVAFDVIEAFDISTLEDMLHSKDTTLDKISICDQVISLGYPSHNPILNLGFLSVLMFVYKIKLIVFVLFIFPIYKCTGRMKELTKKVKYQLFFNDIVVLLVEGHLELTLAGLL